MDAKHTGLEEWPRCCPDCGGWAVYTGTQCAQAWYRCEACGLEVNTSDIDLSEGYAAYVAGNVAHGLQYLPFREWTQGVNNGKR